MPLPQQKLREIIFQMLYSSEVGKGLEEGVLDLLMAELAISRKNIQLARAQTAAILEKSGEIDALIAKASLSYEFERIQAVEKSILRLGVYELLFVPEMPPKVAIAEAMRIAKKFSTPESSSFINAILDHIYKSNLGEKASSTKILEAAKKLEQSERELEMIDPSDLRKNTKENTSEEE
jgi:N utilization substance protein B